MTLEKAIEFGKIFLKTIEDEKGSATYEFVETAVKMMKKEPVLDKIREEIEQLPTTECTETQMIFIIADDFKEDVLEILDKYKAESEEN